MDDDNVGGVDNDGSDEDDGGNVDDDNDGGVVNDCSNSDGSNNDMVDNDVMVMVTLAIIKM